MTPDKIKIARAKLGLSTTDFGALLGVSSRTVENWEQGRREPSTSVIILLDKILEEDNKKALHR